MKVTKKDNLVIITTHDYVDDAIYVLTAKNFKCQIPNASNEIIYGNLTPDYYTCEVFVNGVKVDEGTFLVHPKEINLSV